MPELATCKALLLIPFVAATVWAVAAPVQKDPGERSGAPIQLRVQAAPSIDQVMDLAITRESDVLRSLVVRQPLVETYIQNLSPDADLGAVPKQDHYFLGKLDLSQGMNSRSLVPSPGLGKKVVRFFSEIYQFTFLPNGFAQMILIDGSAFDRRHYDFEFVRREFLGEVRTLVFEVTPKEGSGIGRFLGRIWVEDKAFNIVRFNGTYSPSSLMNRYLHFDSWRVNMGPGLWLPAYVYSEESDYRYFIHRKLSFKSQTRIWGYDQRTTASLDEFTKVMVEAPVERDEGEGQSDLAPVTSLRGWEREAEQNVLERLTRGGLLAPEGEVDKVLSTVVNNLQVTNNLDIQPEVRCRVLLTTPLESFSIGHTIVLSRGLIDVLPDEASLAMVLAHELGHIVLAHRLDTKFAFSDRMLFGDEETFRRFGFRRDAKEEQAADQKAIQLLENSPYKEKLANAGLFLRALSSRAKSLRALIRPHMGNELAGKGHLVRLAHVMDSSPELEMTRTDQMAALPLGGRIKVDPWSGRLELLKNKPVVLLSAREKMPFEVTPFMPYLARVSEARGISTTPPADAKTADAIVGKFAAPPETPPVPATAAPPDPAAPNQQR